MNAIVYNVKDLKKEGHTKFTYYGDFSFYAARYDFGDEEKIVLHCSSSREYGFDVKYKESLILNMGMFKIRCFDGFIIVTKE